VREGRQADYSRGFKKTKQTKDYFITRRGPLYISALSSNSLLTRIK